MEKSQKQKTKISLVNIQGKMSRTEMKSIMGGISIPCGPSHPACPGERPDCINGVCHSKGWATA